MPICTSISKTYRLPSPQFSTNLYIPALSKSPFKQEGPVNSFILLSYSTIYVQTFLNFIGIVVAHYKLAGVIYIV